MILSSSLGACLLSVVATVCLGVTVQAQPSSENLELAFAQELLKKNGRDRAVQYRIDPTLGHPESFHISRTGTQVSIDAGGAAGVLYGVQEVLAQTSVVGAEGRPDFDLRGAVLMMLSSSWAYQSDLSPKVYPWFYDRDLMTRYLDYLFSARLNTLVLWSGHLFPHILDLPEYPDASQFTKEEIHANQEQFRWLATECAKRNITLLTHFYNIHISERQAKALGRSGHDATRYEVPDDFVRGYYRTVLTRYFREFPNVGLYICPGESLALEQQEAWFRDVVFKAARESGKNPKLIIRDWTLDSGFRAALPRLYPNLYSELKHNDESVTSPWPDLRHRTWRKVLQGHIVNLHDPSDATPYRVGSPRFLGEIVRRWKDEGFFTGAWFYPPQCWTWPWTLDSEKGSAGEDKNAKLLAFERDELWHLLEGRYLWKSERDPGEEQKWTSEWLGRKFGNEKVGTLLVEWYDLTGPILPGLQNMTAVRFGNFFPTAIASVQATVDDLLSYRTMIDDPRPQGTTGYTHQRHYSRPVDAFTLELYKQREHTAELKDTRSMPVAQLAQCLSDGQTAECYLRPDKLVDLYLDMATKALDKATEAKRQGGTNPDELRRFVQDSQCLVYTVEFYRLKIRAALEKRLFERTGERKHLVELKSLMGKSVEKYRELVHYARQYYQSGTGMFFADSWEQTLDRKVIWDYEQQLHWIESNRK